MLSQVKSEKDKYLDKKKKLKMLKKKLEELEKLSPKKKSSSYDLIIQITSIYLANKTGWEVVYANKNMDSLPLAKYLNKLKDRNQLICGIIGKENSGKTFFLNLLGKSNFLSGFDQTTVGLSIKFIDLKKDSDLVTFLDSAGMKSPNYYYNTENIHNYTGQNKKMEFEKNDIEELKLKMTTDKVLTEFFIQNFILSICNFLIIMVGHLNQEDQKIIERVKKLYMAKTKIIIVHNFFNLTNVKDINYRIQSDIQDCFTVTKAKIHGFENIYKYHEKTKGVQEDIIHYVIAKQNSEAGNIYNEAVISSINNALIADSEFKQIDILKELMKFWDKNYSFYIQNEIDTKIEKIEDENNNIRIKLAYEENLNLRPPNFNLLGILQDNELKYQKIEMKGKGILEFIFETICFQKEPDIKLSFDHSKNKQILNIEFETKEIMDKEKNKIIEKNIEGSYRKIIKKEFELTETITYKEEEREFDKEKCLFRIKLKKLF